MYRLTGLTRLLAFFLLLSLLSSHAIARDARFIENVALSIHDVTGRRVRTLDVSTSVGNGTVMWEGRNASGRLLPSGVYYVRLEAGGEVTQQTVQLIR